MSPSSPSLSRNARWGLVLFAFYSIFYGIFIVLNVWKPEVMSRLWWGGVNVAIWYGLGLIGSAFALALLYLFCALDEPADETL
jgi:uncharacterized membrane protein (DUF485 family)